MAHCFGLSRLSGASATAATVFARFGVVETSSGTRFGVSRFFDDGLGSGVCLKLQLTIIKINKMLQKINQLHIATFLFMRFVDFYQRFCDLGLLFFHLFYLRLSLLRLLWLLVGLCFCRRRLFLLLLRIV